MQLQLTAKLTEPAFFSVLFFPASAVAPLRENNPTRCIRLHFHHAAHVSSRCLRLIATAKCNNAATLTFINVTRPPARLSLLPSLSLSISLSFCSFFPVDILLRHRCITVGTVSSRISHIYLLDIPNGKGGTMSKQIY